MKRCQKLSAIIYVLVLASLFSFTNCGIPYFINLDDTISWNHTQVSIHKLDVTLTISSRGMEKITDVNIDTNPSIKFFYVLSTNSSTSAPPATRNVNSDNDFRYNIHIVPNQFITIFKGMNGNGISWASRSNTSGPGFYLYTKDNATYRNYAREFSSVTDPKADELGLLVGTFSKTSPIGSNDPEDYDFGSSPFMDTVIPISTWSGVGNPLTYNFSLEVDQSLPDDPIGIKFTDLITQTQYFADYRRNLFPQSSDEKNLNNFILYEDSYFHKPLYDEIKNNSEVNLYLHIWATLYGGDGSFTNIYWSDLTYLGNIQLF